MSEFISLVVVPGVIGGVFAAAALHVASKYGMQAVIGVYLFQLFMVCLMLSAIYYREELALERIRLEHPQSKALRLPHLVTVAWTLRGAITEIISAFVLLAILIRNKTAKETI